MRPRRPAPRGPRSDLRRRAAPGPRAASHLRQAGGLLPRRPHPGHDPPPVAVLVEKHPGRSGLHRGLGVQSLVVVRRVGVRHQQRRDSHRRQFEQRSGAGAADGEIRRLIGQRHLLEKGLDPRRASRWRAYARRTSASILAPRGVHELHARPARPPGRAAPPASPVQPVSPLAPAEDQHRERLADRGPAASAPTRASPARISARTGLPVTCARPAGRQRAVSAKDTATAAGEPPQPAVRQTRGRRSARGSPGGCAPGRRPPPSVPRHIRPRRTRPGVELPQEVSGLPDRARKRPAAKRRPRHPVPLTGVAVRPRKAHPRRGKMVASTPRAAPTKRASASGRRARRASCTANAGKRWPPVPPPVITTRTDTPRARHRGAP